LKFKFEDIMAYTLEILIIIIGIIYGYMKPARKTLHIMKKEL